MDSYFKIALTLITALLAVAVLSLLGVIPRRTPPVGAAQFSVNDAANHCYVLKDNTLYVYEMEWPNGPQLNLTLTAMKPLPDASQLKPYVADAVAPPKPTSAAKKLNSPILQSLLDTIPADAQPRLGEEEGLIDRNSANKWLADKLGNKGIPLEMTANVESCTVRQSPYSNDSLAGSLLFGYPDAGGVVGTARIGGADWSVFLPTLHWRQLDPASAKRLRDLKGKEATVKGTCYGLSFLYQDGLPTLLVNLEDIVVEKVSPDVKAAILR